MFDLDRIKASINSGIVSLPRGLRKYQLRQYLRDRHHPGQLHKGFTATEMLRGIVHG